MIPESPDGSHMSCGSNMDAPSASKGSCGLWASGGIVPFDYAQGKRCADAPVPSPGLAFQG